MIKNFFLVAWRSLLRNKSVSAINIAGLAVGMAVVMLIGLWVTDELTYNHGFKNHERIARVMQHQTSNGVVGSQNSIPYPLGEELQTKYASHFKYVVMSSWNGPHILSAGEKKLTRQGSFMDVDAPAMLSLEILKGNGATLSDPSSILLSASVAKALFNDADPINQPLLIDGRLPVKVTGVYRDIPFNANFRDLQIILPWKLLAESEPWIKRARDKQEWGNNSFQLFVQLADHADYASTGKAILLSKQKHVPEEDKRFKAQIFLHPMDRWHLYNHWNDSGIQTGGSIEYVWLFGTIGIFVLILACINFMNLSTARSEKRAREVGIRKTIGSLRKQLIMQFYSESVVVVFIAFLLALVLVVLSLPWFNTLSGKIMKIPWLNPWAWLIALLFILFTGLVAGSYPALYLSSFRPVKVLKGTFRAGRLASLPRKALVVLQFSISLALIIGTFVIKKQIEYSQSRPTGYSREGLVMIGINSPEYEGKYDLLRQVLKESGAIEQMATSSSPLTGVWSNNGGFNWEGKDPGQDGEFGTIWVSHDFGKTVNWEFTQGRDLSRDFATDSSAIVVNEAAVKFMHVTKPVGMTLRWGNDSNATKLHVVGVIRDMLMESPYEPVSPTIYLLSVKGPNWITLKLNRNATTASSLEKVGTTFKKYVPSAPFEYQFADQQYAEKFTGEIRIGKLATFFAALAIFISCLGLFGLASYVAEQRIKEIGIRKVLGASVTSLWALLSKEFLLLVLLSCFIATPAAAYFMHNWLLKYSYRASMSWTIFITAGILAMIITILTVSYQALKAATSNPVKSLRSE